jgi:putative phosphoribosyl transferase
VVDDGIATGATMRAALRAIRRQGPRHLVLAAPVAAPQTLAELGDEADEIVCLYRPEWLGAIGAFYQDFTQVTDEEVIDLLSRATVPPDQGRPNRVAGGSN